MMLSPRNRAASCQRVGSDAFELSEWWKPVLGYTDVPDDPNEPGDEECMIVDPHSDHRLLFIEVDDFRNDVGRIHLDLVPTDLCRDDEIDRVVALGATQIADRRNRDGTGWMVLADPTGNRFCILRSDEERIETSASVARDDSEVSCAQVLRN